MIPLSIDKQQVSLTKVTMDVNLVIRLVDSANLVSS